MAAAAAVQRHPDAYIPGGHAIWCPDPDCVNRDGKRTSLGVLADGVVYSRHQGRRFKFRADADAEIECCRCGTVWRPLYSLTRETGRR